MMVVFLAVCGVASLVCAMFGSKQDRQISLVSGVVLMLLAAAFLATNAVMFCITLGSALLVLLGSIIWQAGTR